MNAYNSPKEMTIIHVESVKQIPDARSCYIYCIGGSRTVERITEIHEKRTGIYPRIAYIRVDAPKTSKQEPFTKLYGGGAIYCITPCDEQTMNATAEGLQARPIEIWKLNLSQPQLTDPSGGLADSPF